MDKILIHSKFMKGLISKIIQRSIRKSNGIDVVVDLNYMNVDTDGDNVTINLDGKVCLRKADFAKIILKEI